MGVTVGVIQGLRTVQRNHEAFLTGLALDVVN